MKILSLTTNSTYDIDIKRRGENAMPCPECSECRKNKGKKSFSWNGEKETGYCHNCDARFVTFKPIEKKSFVVPKPINNTLLSDQHVNYFEGRMISKATLLQVGIYSSTEWMPQFDKVVPVMCFPFYRDSRLINVKYRGAEKSFKLIPKAELIFFNLDSLKGARDYAIITEGEIDALSFIEIGLSNVVSVPNGAKGSNLTYLDSSIDTFEKIEKVYIAVDTDEKGIELREELIRRIGPDKCFIIEYKGFKDANELLQKEGGLALHDCFKYARQAKVEGLVDIADYYNDLKELYANGLKKGALLDIPELDNIVSWELGRLAVVTGVPGHGKSEFVDFLVSKLNVLHGWKVAFFSPENFPMHYHLMKLIPKLSGKKFTPQELSLEEFERTFSFIRDNYHFIAPTDDQKFESILELAKIAVRRNGIKILVIDPYNKIEHQRDRSESETDYISRFLDRLVTFAKTYNVLVILVAHPRKMESEKDSLKVKLPTLYDINGSANFYNKCDYGLSIYRDREKGLTTVHVMKVKFRHLGEGGQLDMTYNYFNGRYENKDLPMAKWSRSSWIEVDEFRTAS